MTTPNFNERLYVIRVNEGGTAYFVACKTVFAVAESQLSTLPTIQAAINNEPNWQTVDCLAVENTPSAGAIWFGVQADQDGGG